MKKKLSAVGLLILMMTVSVGIAAPKKQYYSLSTCPVGGVWSVVGAGMANVVNSNSKILSLSAEITGGGVENLRMLATGETEFAFINGYLVYEAYKGIGTFDGKPIQNIRGIMGGEVLVFQLYTLAQSDIKSYRDLKGKKIACGSIGSAKSVFLTLTMNAYGLEINKDWTPEYISDQDGADALADGLVDAVFYSGGLRAAAPASVSETHNVRFIPVDLEQIEKIKATNPAFAVGSIPGGTYKNNPDEISTVACPSAIICNAGLDDAYVYEFVKLVFDNQAKVNQTHSTAKEYSPANVTRGLKGVIPYHPGAEKYFKEKSIAY